MLPLCHANALSLAASPRQPVILSEAKNPSFHSDAPLPTCSLEAIAPAQLWPSGRKYCVPFTG